MERRFVEEVAGNYRLRIPFEEIYTSVFFAESEEGKILVDCATTSEDVDEWIVPALEMLGYGISDVDRLVLTHRHSDHAGGLARVLALAPKIEVITSVCPLFLGLCTYPLAGHTEDSIGVFDERTHTLITGDGLQGAGVGKYRCYVKNREAYLETIERIENDKRIQNILFSHAYEPWNHDGVFGRREVERSLASCRMYLE